MQLSKVQARHRQAQRIIGGKVEEWSELRGKESQTEKVTTVGSLSGVTYNYFPSGAHFPNSGLNTFKIVDSKLLSSFLTRIQ